MPTIQLVERDPTLREWSRLHLSAAGYTVATFDEGRRALEAARLEPPDLLVIATDQPAANAFALAAAARSNVRTALVPILFVVPAHEPETLAQAISIEPQGVITKPLTRTVLLESVVSRLGTARDGPRSRDPLGSGMPMTGAATTQPGASGLVADTRNASVLAVVLRNFVSLARASSAKTLDLVLQRFNAAAREAVIDQGGWIARGDATGFFALFEDGPRSDRTHASRAVEAALGVVVAARRAKRWAESTLPDAALPDLSIGCGVHSGEVIIARLSGSGPLALTVAGQTADLSQRFDGRAKGLGWSVAASEAAMSLAGSRFQTGRRGSLTDTDHGVTIPIVEVVGFNPGAAKPGELPGMAEAREAVLANTMLARLAGDADPATTDRTILVSARRAPPAETYPELPDRRIERRLGQSPFVTAYAALHVPTDREEAVKVVRIRETPPGFAEDYLEAYRKISGLEQRNVMTVYEVGRTTEIAYVAAERLTGESLADMIRKRLPVGLALNCLAQMCLALDAVHGMGLAHGALRASHFLSRKDRVLVLADFNVSERVSQALGLTRPANAGAGRSAGVWSAPVDETPRSDFEALGAILYAMLTSDMQFMDGVEISMRPRELVAATRLPLALSPLQPCLDGLLGLGPGKAFERVEDVLVELLAVKEIFPFDLRYTDTDPGVRLRQAGKN